MNKVADILARKGSTVYTVDKQQTVLEAIKTMVGHNVGALVVTDGDKIFGIFTERDYLRRIVLEDRKSDSTRISEVATERLVVVDPARTLDECMSLMTSARIRHLPVLDGRSLAGIISIGDIVKYLNSEREAEVRYLTDYISGKYPA